jgi:hypothetical protein
VAVGVNKIDEFGVVVQRQQLKDIALPRLAGSEWRIGISVLTRLWRYSD